MPLSRLDCVMAVFAADAGRVFRAVTEPSQFDRWWGARRKVVKWLRPYLQGEGQATP